MRNSLKDAICEKVSKRHFKALNEGWNSKFSQAVQSRWSSKIGSWKVYLTVLKISLEKQARTIKVEDSGISTFFNFRRYAKKLWLLPNPNFKICFAVPAFFGSLIIPFTWGLHTIDIWLASLLVHLLEYGFHYKILQIE